MRPKARRLWKARRRLAHPECRTCPARLLSEPGRFLCTAGFQLGVTAQRNWWRLVGYSQSACRYRPKISSSALPPPPAPAAGDKSEEPAPAETVAALISGVDDSLIAVFNGRTEITRLLSLLEAV